MSADDRTIIDFTPAVSDERVRDRVGSEAPIIRLFEDKDGLHWSFFNGDQWMGRDIGGSLKINRRWASFRSGYTYSLRPESHFYKRWFEFPDLGKRGWAIIFQAFDPAKAPEAVTLDEAQCDDYSDDDNITRLNFINSGRRAEFIAGWVPPEDEAKADEWIAFLNAEIQARVREEAEEEAAARSKETPANV